MWVFVIFIGFVVVHVSIIIIFIIIGRHPPDILLLPRFEITVSLLLIAPLVGGCASLFVGVKAWQVALGVILFLVLPLLLWGYYIGYLWYAVSFKTPQKRKANYLVSLT